MSDRCSICGAHLSENNSEGVGYECKAALQKAKVKIALSDPEHSLTYYWRIQVNVLQALFIETFSKTKFRSIFKIDFYQSMCKAERVSKRQLGIMEDWLTECNDNRYHEALERIRIEKRTALENWCNEIRPTREQIEVARREIRTK